MAGETEYAQIDALARSLFAAEEPGVAWSALDPIEHVYWRKTAQRKLQQAACVR